MPGHISRATAVAPSSKASCRRRLNFSPSTRLAIRADHSGMVKPRMAAWPEAIMMAA